MHYQVSCTFLCVILYIYSQNVAADQEVAHVEKVLSEKNLAPEQIRGIETFFNLVGVGKTEILNVSEEVLRLRLLPSLGVTAKDITHGREIFLCIKPDGKVVYMYSAIDKTPLVDQDSLEIKGKTLKDAIQEDKAFEIAKQILQSYSLDLSKQNYQIRLEDVYGKEPKELYRAVWSIKKEFTFKGTPCPFAFVAILVSAASGEVARVMYTPIIPPAKLAEEKITAEQALEIAKKDLIVRDVMFGETSCIRKVIAPANERFTSHSSLLSEQPVNTYLCWEVPFSQFEPFNKVEMRACVFVNVETGKIIGGNSD